MDYANLRYQLQYLSTFLPDVDEYTTYRAVIRMFRDLRRDYRSLVSPVRTLGCSREGRPIYHIALGHGQLHTVYDLMPHGGELLMLTGGIEDAAFRCENPSLLKDRTIHYLLAGPDEAIRNLQGWGRRESLEDFVRASILLHWRHPHPMLNDAWSYPIWRNGIWVDNPTPGARAGMQLMQEIKDADGTLVCWVCGHNRHVGIGTQFLYSGPNAATVVSEIENAAKWYTRLDDGPADGEYHRRYAGTEASWGFATGNDILAYDPTAEVGDSAYGWGRHEELFPNMSAFAAEIPMLGPKHPHEWFKKITRGEAQRHAREQTSELREFLPHIIDIAWRMPDGNDPHVSATRALATPGFGWGTRQPEPKPLDEPISPSEHFDTVCAGPLFGVRRAAPALAMLMEHDKTVQKVTHEDPLELAGRLFAAMRLPMDWSWLSLAHNPVGQSARLQIHTAEIAAHGALGIHLYSV